MQRGLDLSQREAGNSLSPSPAHLQGDKAAEMALRALIRGEHLLALE